MIGRGGSVQTAISDVSPGTAENNIKVHHGKRQTVKYWNRFLHYLSEIRGKNSCLLADLCVFVCAWTCSFDILRCLDTALDMHLHDLFQRRQQTNREFVFHIISHLIPCFLLAKEVMANTCQIHFFLSPLFLFVLQSSQSNCEVKTRCLNSRKC